MNKTAHSIAGLGAGLITSCFVTSSLSDLNVVIPLVSASLVSSLMPDIDNPNSYMGHKNKVVSNTLNMTVGHRGVTHTPLAMIVVSSIVYLILSKVVPNYAIYYAIGSLIGYGSHLLLDMLTPKGIMLFYPLSKKYYRIIGLKTPLRDAIVSLIIILITATTIYLKINGSI